MSAALCRLGCVLCTGLLVLASASWAAALPDKPIVPKPLYGTECHTPGYVDGIEQCGWLEKLGEPVAPVTDPETRLAIRLIWSVGDRGTVITLRYEVLTPEQGLLKAYFNTTGGSSIVEGRAEIWASDVQELIAANAGADIPSLPATLPEPNIVTHSDGIETVTICYSGFTLAEVRPDSQRVIERSCPDKRDRAAILAKALIRLAQKHFPDVGSNETWRKVLQ